MVNKLLKDFVEVYENNPRMVLLMVFVISFLVIYIVVGGVLMFEQFQSFSLLKDLLNSSLNFT
jgi:hypothetical protein